MAEQASEQPATHNHTQIPPPVAERRLLTHKSLAFGALGVFIMSGLAGFHNDVLGGSLMIGTHMPGGVFAYLIFIGLFWNGLWVLLKRREMALNTRELAIVMAVSLVACYPPTEGLFAYFFRVVMLPWYYAQGNPHWAEHGILMEFVPKFVFPEPWPGEGVGVAGYDLVYRGFFTGLAKGSQTVPVWELPFKAWVTPMLVWGPLIITLALVVISLQFIVHRQWSEHEQLPFPVAQVARSFCQTPGDASGVPLIFANRLFWWGFIPVAVYLLVMTLSAWYPQSIPNPRELFPSFRMWNLPMDTTLPAIRKVPNHWSLNGQAFCFTLVGIAYFIGTETGLMMGLTMPLLILTGVIFHQITGIQMEHAYTSSSRFGAGFAYCGILIFTGWTYYRSVFAQALMWRGHSCPRTDNAAPTAARVFILALAAFIVILTFICDSWVMALIYTIFTLVMFLTLSRVVCESGIPFIQPGYLIGDMLVRLFGPAAIGPRPLTTLLWTTGVLSQDPRECLMPFVATAVKTADDAGVRLRRFFWLVCAVVVIAICVSFIATFYTSYNFNPMSRAWAADAPPQMHFNNAVKQFTAMKISGVFDASLAASPLARLRMTTALPMELRFFVFGLCAVVAISLLRFRFSRFPIHPVLLVVAGSYPSQITWGSFLIGWFVKSLVVRFGGGSVYLRLKPLFIGIIAGELFMVGMNVLTNFIYYLAHGSPPPVSVWIMPF